MSNQENQGVTSLTRRLDHSVTDAPAVTGLTRRLDHSVTDAPA